MSKKPFASIIMNSNILNIGIELVNEKIVAANDTANHYGSGLVEVFATPAMVAFMEKTCLELVQPYLNENESTVGTEISVKHLKATALNDKVWCKAQLTEIDGRKLSFSVSAWDEAACIGNGTHTRFVINRAKFMEKLQKKA
jgi:fluoroacetyl-CoA thioesterase